MYVAFTIIILLAAVLGMLIWHFISEKRHVKRLFKALDFVFKDVLNIRRLILELKTDIEERHDKLEDSIQDVKDAVVEGPMNRAMDGIANILNYDPFNPIKGKQDGGQK